MMVIQEILLLIVDKLKIKDHLEEELEMQLILKPVEFLIDFVIKKNLFKFFLSFFNF